MSVSVFNRCWSKVILETLVRQGVSHFCIAPGSRSTPLTLEAARLEQGGRAKCHTHFDERGLGFLALGLAKASKKTVAIIVTSGTAVANLYPAVIEARQSGGNLIVLSADRPPELLECGANQAILQQHIFADYPVASINLPRPSQDYAPNWLISTLEQACYRQRNQAGVVHINVPFAEPMYEANEDAIEHHPWLAPLQTWFNQHKSWNNYQKPQKEVVMHENWDHWRTQRGIILVGKLPLEQAMGIRAWAETQGWIMLTDIQSGVEPTLPYADIWLANKTVQQKLLQADIVVQFGSHFISKRINQFMSAFKGEYWIVEPSDKAVDPHHHAHTRFNGKIYHWLRSHPPLRQKPWLLEPIALAKFCASFVEQQVGGNLNEASLAHHLERLLPSNGILFLGNSLFVRLVDALTKLPEGYPVYTNRGASGIDGLFATAAGLSIGSNQPLVAMLGDTSALYDLNSLALFKQVNQPTILFVINNNGGAIFDMLPVDEEMKEKFYRMPHNLDLSHAAAMFDLKYARPYTWADLSSVLKQAYFRRETTLIEIKVNSTDGSTIYKRLIEQISNAVIGA
ncbi:2-succinyl-5-enolpyruvyl-6-hydroxy-3-cyclohexene-1-carboxylic-acid synthase [Avibacterium paragallinarum]|uniref:2-succinyl-5-enolpyruvyl-6-hydroxy-3-cyclohexene-1-carboxylate synthase n=1 Tax=Avibacterium paragallinarum TaxID=728 RepID=A0A377IAD6_AVIPA|nr:2-succinyl-5-enolpyruvyl-6-hydroxy-3-cyclohexene-1-carboxylic-acid synthase [Avibacterium paragallinarum]POY47345.1 2-succinyl-5-enolpyruvyl-6-hydroxy-3-cyclohexene-1-carboxylic-acid synthase [Avibacterium paragallinarum]RZN77043.1 2-succinyl-5-enolpyruvyl-6-hydroxy-3-cyclohexene-1-carboxylic-acid synthase [Avibacterium paragallinarum]STO71709.1 bifunctional 2-oxoglutarate decarboxylase/ SHCHC synthase [Avibacterium paragallinarum]